MTSFDLDLKVHDLGAIYWEGECKQWWHHMTSFDLNLKVHDLGVIECKRSSSMYLM